MRRNKQEVVRHLIEQDYPSARKFIWPIFIVEGKNVKEPIKALPGQFYYSVDIVADEVREVFNKNNIGGVLIFGVIDNKLRAEDAKEAYNQNGLAQKAISELRAKMPEIAIFGDIGLTGYTKSGHAQIIDSNRFDNDKSLDILKKIAISHAKAGATGVAPSGMIDGQVQKLRKELDNNGFGDVIIMSYSTKFNSNLYRTFPFDTSSTERCALDRGEYLESYRSPESAIKESVLDEQEGADMLMVKPSLFYLDIIQKIKKKTSLPLAVYNVSGEYAMLNAMIEKGFAEKNGLVKESLCALNRAGADIIISYWANQYTEIFG